MSERVSTGSHWPLVLLALFLFSVCVCLFGVLIHGSNNLGGPGENSLSVLGGKTTALIKKVKIKKILVFLGVHLISSQSWRAVKSSSYSPHKAGGQCAVQDPRRYQLSD